MSADVDNNSARAGDDGALRGRRLTCIFYANEGWQQADGGVLRIHRQVGGEGAEGGEQGARSTEHGEGAKRREAAATSDGVGDTPSGGASARVDIPPLANRLVVFHSECVTACAAYAPYACAAYACGRLLLGVCDCSHPPLKHPSTHAPKHQPGKPPRPTPLHSSRSPHPPHST